MSEAPLYSEKPSWWLRLRCPIACHAAPSLHFLCSLLRLSCSHLRTCTLQYLGIRFEREPLFMSFSCSRARCITTLYRGTSPITKRPPPYEAHTTLGVGLGSVPGGCVFLRVIDPCILAESFCLLTVSLPKTTASMEAGYRDASRIRNRPPP